MKDPGAVNRILRSAMQYASAGRYDDALRALRSEGEAALGHPAGRNILGGIYMEQGRFDEAVSAFERAAKAVLSFPEAHFNRGLALEKLGRRDEALSAFNRAIKQRRDYPQAYFSKGNVLNSLGRIDEAVAAFGEAVRIKPGFAEAHLARAASLGRQGNFIAALAAADQMIKALPRSAAAEVARATALRGLKRYEEALAAADRAIALDPKDAEAHAIRGFVLGDLLRIDEQMAALETAAELNPIRHLHSRAVALSEAGRAAEARDVYAEALRLAPDDPLIHHHSSLIRLFLGDFAGGFAEHEWRLKTPDFVGVRYQALAPPWTGEDVAGRSLLVYGEQGLGDAIQFARYLNPVVATGAKVSLIVPSPLRSLVRSSFSGIEVLAETKGATFDRQVSLVSLAHVFQTRLDTIPAEVPYLAADPALVDKWRARIGAEGFRIGVAWQGNPDLAADRFRSVDPKEFAPLAAISGVRLISLQAIHGLDRLDDLPPDIKIESFGDEIARNPEGVSEIAGLLHSLDLVVSVDSAIAHLAGALARPVFVALRKQPEWRWMEDRSDSPWYPTMKLFRQTDPFAWGDVYQAMAREVAARLSAGNGASR
jgi:tetratricopeptide (TPR) repeat protein